MKRVLIIALAALSIGMLAPAAHAATLVYASMPESQITGWTVPVIVIQPGDGITYENLDPVGRHNVIAETADASGTPYPQDIGPDTNPWCSAYSSGHCPIFWSQTIGAAGPGPLQGNVGVPVLGLSALNPGSYQFYCSVHPNTMVGTLIVLPA